MTSPWRVPVHRCAATVAMHAVTADTRPPAVGCRVLSLEPRRIGVRADDGQDGRGLPPPAPKAFPRMAARARARMMRPTAMEKHLTCRTPR